MISVTERIELDQWSGFQICGGRLSPGDDPDFDYPALKLERCCTTDTRDVDARAFAKVVPLEVNEEVAESEGEFKTILHDVVYGKHPDWKLVSFRVFPDGVWLKYASRNYNFHLVDISGVPFHMTILVPVINDPAALTEAFTISVGQCFSGEYAATIRRSGDRHIHYELLTDDTLGIMAPKPQNKIAKAIAKMLFPDWYNKKVSCVHYRYDVCKKTYLEIHRELPILPTVE